ncbi:MAG: hypothetical protein AB7H97_20930 [Pseudobdellovibrionaceae bacterium]
MIKPILIALILILSFKVQAQLPEESKSTSGSLEFEPTDGDPTAEEPPPPIDDELEPAEEEPAKKSYAEDNKPLPPEQRASSESGQPIFDWSKHRGEREVPHPFAEKGLLRIRKDGTYIYKTEESKQTNAFSFAVGMYEPEMLSNPDAQGPTAEFNNNYDQTNSPMIMAHYEWQFMKSPVGKFGLRFGSGLYVAQGNGHFKSGGVNDGLTPQEIFTFIAMPNSVGLVYRMHFWDKQLLVPYGEGGAIAWSFAEMRDDNKNPKFGGAAGAYAAAGLAINLTYFDKFSAISLDREYGINRVYLTAEYRPIFPLSERYDFTGNMIDAGFLMEF